MATMAAARPTRKPPLNPTYFSHFSLEKWHPNPQNNNVVKPFNNQTKFFQVCQKLSPLARYICDSFRKHRRWGPDVVSDLDRLRRVNPDLVTEVLKVEDDPVMCSKFFHWAGKQKGYRHNYMSYNAFTYALYRLNRFRAADQVPELMQMQGKPPTEKQFEILIRLHSDHNRGLRVFYVYEKMKKFGVTPRVFLYNRIMDSLLKTGYLDLALSVYDDFRKAGLVEETMTYMILIKGLCRNGRIPEMLQLLGRMKQQQPCRKPDVFAYTAMIRILVADGNNLDACLRVWDEMRMDNVEPDAIAYTTLISALCKGNRVEKGYEFFEDMKKKGRRGLILIDRAIYISLVEGFVANGDVGSAIDLFKDMVESGYRPDLCIYSSLIHGFCRFKQVEKALKLFQIAVDEGLQPDFTTVNPMLKVYAESGDMEKFLMLLSQMDRLLGASVLDGLSMFFSMMVEREDSIPLALTVFNDLKNKGYCSISICNVMLSALYTSNQRNAALSLFGEIIKDSDSNLNLNVVPDSTTYSHAILCFVDVGDMKEACSCYTKIKELDSDSVPSIEAYRSLVKGLTKMGEIDVAMSLVQDCLANVTTSAVPMEFKYTLNIIHTCKSNDAEKVLEVVDEMIDNGGILDEEIVFCAVISGMCRHGTVDEARKVFSGIKERELVSEANMILYDDMLLEHMQKKTADLVLSGLKFFGLESKLKAKGCTLLSSSTEDPP